jgi:D-alanyl-D-alanine carboxypeptidase
MLGDLLMTSSARERQAESCLAQLIQRGEVPGIQYVVVGPAGVEFESCCGITDVYSGHPVTSSTTFMASSVTKTLTAAGVLRLKDRGQLDLDSSLGTYYPSHPYNADIRIDQLLNQTSGVPNPMPLRWLHLAEDHDDYDEDEALKDILTQHSNLRFAPGSRYAYSNLAYWLLGKVIEQVSGLSYADYMRTSILDPLGISSDEMGCVIKNSGRHACGHLRRRSVLGLLMPLMMSNEVFAKTAAGRRRFQPVYMNGPAYGGLIGTARAFSKFLQDQLRPDPVLFSGETKDLFFSEQTDSSGRRIETTLGWHRGELSGNEYYGKPGGGPGFQSNIRVYPKKAIATVWLANETGASEGPIHALTDSLDRHFL